MMRRLSVERGFKRPISFPYVSISYSGPHLTTHLLPGRGSSSQALQTLCYTHALSKPHRQFGVARALCRVLGQVRQNRQGIWHGQVAFLLETPVRPSAQQAWQNFGQISVN
jgi:hypothetical protein